MINGLRFIKKIDLPLIFMLIIISFVGLAILYSASDANILVVRNQLIRVLLGFAILIIFCQIPPKYYREVAPFFFAVSVILIIWVALAGVGKGASRWLDLGFLRFQPSELLKLSLPMMVAWYLHYQRLPLTITSLIIALVIIIVPTIIIVIQPDLGTAVLIAGSGLAVIFFAGLKWRFIFGMIFLLLATMPVAWMFLHEYQRNRVRTLFDPESDALNQGWNIIQSKIAIGSGGISGKGWQQGTQTHLDFLPEGSTDFILSVIAEEFGLIGILTLLILYFIIISRALMLAMNGRDTFTRLLASSLVVTFSFYVIVNAGMVSGLLPVVGVPLPLISYGGTSIVTLLASFGIIMSVNSHPKRLSQRKFS